MSRNAVAARCPLRARSRSCTSRIRHAGVTLIELVVSMVIVGIAVSGVLLALHQTMRHSADPMVLHQAVAIGEAYLEEILLKPFDEMAASGAPEGPLGPDAGEGSRPLFDDVNDYHALANNGCLVPGQGACDQDGNPIVGLEAYNINVTVTNIGDLGPPGSETPFVDTVRVDVQVTGPNDTNVMLSGYRTNYGP
jgi:MSHA pilin protein MshD